MWFLATFLFAQILQAQPETFLKQHVGFSALDMASLERGQIIVKLPRTPETREVAAFAIMRLDVPKDFFIERVRDIVTFKKSVNVLQIGKFSDPPRLEDLAGLTLDAVDIESLRRCKPGSCDLKMSAKAIERFRSQMDWSAPNYRERVTVLIRQLLLEHVQSYLRAGNAGLGEYNDKPYKLLLAEEFKALLQPAPYMYRYDSDFQSYLENFPASGTAGAENFVYWSKEKFGLKPVISATHITIHKRNSPGGTDFLIASKGIYATHYFEASLGLTGFIHSQDSNPARTYLIYINRSRTDALRGFLAGLKRSLITGRLRDGAKKNMEIIKQKLESEYRK